MQNNRILHIVIVMTISLMLCLPTAVMSDIGLYCRTQNQHLFAPYDRNFSTALKSYASARRVCIEHGAELPGYDTVMRCLRPLIRFLHATGLAAKNEPHALYFAETIGDNVGLAIDLHKENFPVFVPGQDEIEYMPVICSRRHPLVESVAKDTGQLMIMPPYGDHQQVRYASAVKFCNSVGGRLPPQGPFYQPGISDIMTAARAQGPYWQQYNGSMASPKLDDKRYAICIKQDFRSRKDSSLSIFMPAFSPFSTMSEKFTYHESERICHSHGGQLLSNSDAKTCQGQFQTSPMAKLRSQPGRPINYWLNNMVTRLGKKPEATTSLRVPRQLSEHHLHVVCARFTHRCSKHLIFVPANSNFYENLANASLSSTFCKTQSASLPANDKDVRACVVEALEELQRRQADFSFPWSRSDADELSVYVQGGAVNRHGETMYSPVNTTRNILCHRQAS